MPSRRLFLQTSLLASAGLALAPPRWMQALGPRAAAPALRLFFADDGLPALRARFESARFGALRARLQGVDRAAERRFLAEEVRLDDHLYDINRIGTFVPQMAFLYAMTGDEDAAALAAEGVRTLMRFPKWDYFLTGDDAVFGLQRAPSSVMATALAADWLGDYVDAAERRAWLGTMGERGCEACYRALWGMRHPDEARGWHIDPESTYLEHRPGDRGLDISRWPWILDRTNLKAVPASALAVGALAYELALGASADTARWLEQALYSIATFERLYARDGSYDEGVSYAGYTSLHLAQATDALARHGRPDLYDLINWPGYVTYLREMALPTADDPQGIVNFGDAWNGPSAAVPFWTAGRSHDAQAQWYGEHLAHDFDEWSLLWYDEAVPAEAPPARPHVWLSDLDWVAARTGYTADDLVVALRSGGPANHEHADRNSLLVKAFGERLVADPRRPPYGFTDPSWMLRTTAGHSAVLIDGEGHQYHDGREGTNASQAAARVVQVLERDGYLAWASDATPAYALVQPDVAGAVRTVVMLPGLAAIVVMDKVTKRATPSTLEARFFVANDDGQGAITSARGGFVVSRPRARLHAFAYAPQGVAVEAARLPIPEEEARKHPFAAVATAQKSLTPLLVTVLLPAPAGAEAGSATFEPAGGGVVVRIRQAGGAATVRIADTGTRPEFAVEG